MRWLKFLICATSALAANTFSVVPDSQILRPGTTATFSAKAAQTNSAVAVDWTIRPSIRGALVSETRNQAVLSFTAPGPSSNELKHCVEMAVTATAASGEAHTSYLAILPGDTFSPQAARPEGSMVISIIGFEQTGAASASGTQKFFFDVFQSYPLPVESSHGPKADIYGPPWHWWEDLRVASYPQQVSAPVSQFAAQFTSQWANLPVNKLAQSGEFRIGLERRIGAFDTYFLRRPVALYERTSLGLMFYFGAQGSLSSPAATAQVFTLPAQGTPQRAAFDRAFPAAQYPDLTQPATGYAGFVPLNQSRAYQQYGAGFRLTTRFLDPTGRMLPAPAMLSASFGRNEAVTGGNRRRIAGTFEAFYPVPMGMKGTQMGAVYLFGRASIALGNSAVATTPLTLTPADVAVTDPRVAVIAVPAAGDLYTIGIGIDAVQVFKGLFNLGKPASP